MMSLQGWIYFLDSIPHFFVAQSTSEWWQDITLPLLEQARLRLRTLIKLIEKPERQPLYTDFADELGSETLIDLPGLGGTEFERFQAKARHFLLAHADHLAIYKLRFNQPLTAQDLQELERMLLDAAIGTEADLEAAKQQGLGLFIRSLVGLDWEAAKAAFGQFLSGSTASANQIEFINLIINYLTQHGSMDPALLYESPFTDLSHQGPEGLFTQNQVNDLITTLHQVQTATAA